MNKPDDLLTDSETRWLDSEHVVAEQFANKTLLFDLAQRIFIMRMSKEPLPHGMDAATASYHWAKVFIELFNKLGGSASAEAVAADESAVGR